MSNPFTPFTHPETSATTNPIPFDLLDRIAMMLPEALGLAEGATVDDRRSATAVMNQVPLEAMHVALEVADGTSVAWDPTPVITFLAERDRLAQAAHVLRRLAVVETRLSRHLASTGVPAAQAVLDLYLLLKRRTSRRGEPEVEAGTQRLVQALPQAGRQPAKRVKKQPEPTPAK